MDEETFASHLNTLKETILDEEKLVTYASISKEFCIHVNESKTLLKKVVEDIRKNQPETVLNVNYIISGLSDSNKAYTYVCSENDIVDHRKRFKIVFFEHLYSINKGSPSVDKVAFMAITKFEDYHLCSGLIKSNLCLKRSADEIANLKSRSVVSVTEEKSVKPPSKKIKEEKLNNATMNGHSDPKILPEVKTESIKQEKTSPRKDNASNIKQKQEVKNGGKTQKGISGFFSRSETNSKKTTKETNKDSEVKIKQEKEVNKSNTIEEMDVDDEILDEPKKSKTNGIEEKTATGKKKASNEIEEKMATDKKKASNGIEEKTTTDKKKASNGTSKNKTKNSNKSLSEIKKNAKVDKKRKRVLCVSDSDSDEEKNDPFADEEDTNNQQLDVESEDEIPPTPAVNTIKVTSAMLNPKKRRKIVNKTYTDEDGYILTRKEEIYESLSENEDIAETKENVKTEVKKVELVSPKKKTESKTEVSPKGKKNGPKNKKKISPPQKGKQASIMSFFNKK